MRKAFPYGRAAVAAIFLAASVAQAEWMHFHWEGVVGHEYGTAFTTGRFDVYVETAGLRRPTPGEYFDINLIYSVLTIDMPSGEEVHSSNGVRSCLAYGPFFEPIEARYWYGAIFGNGGVSQWWISSPLGTVWEDQSMEAFVAALSASDTTAYATPVPEQDPWFGSTSSVTVTFESPPVLGCYADLNADLLVDDQDFLIFAAAYDKVYCWDTVPATCPSDFNHDTLVLDEDFVMFVTAYNALLCP